MKHQTRIARTLLAASLGVVALARAALLPGLGEVTGKNERGT